LLAAQQNPAVHVCWSYRLRKHGEYEREEKETQIILRHYC
jgi:hypothetical protein